MKHVPAGRLRLDPETHRLDRSGDTELNPRDRPAVEAALRLRDEGVLDEVVLVSLGPEEAVGSVREGLAMGADRAVVCSDARVAGSDLLATSRLLAHLLAREEPALSLFGQVAADSEGALLWSAVAERLAQPALSQVSELHLIGSRARVQRQTEVGFETLESPLPCVISVTDAVEARFPTFREMKAARDRPVVVVDLDGLGFAPELVGERGSGSRVLGQELPPPSGREAIILDVEDGTRERAIAFLAERGLI